jgi:peptidoglycan/LPS O-acetylase OafA/YrhL
MRGAGGQYFPQIDGLRAVAVVAVLIYHLRLDWGDGFLLPGGFLGVDIFFVISGFLITRILLTELNETGRVSIKRFYWRRVRRILPALLAVILASIPVAWAVMLPSDFKDFGLSLVASLGFLGNVYWYVTQSAYGAPGALLQPFLHTWSLGVEEQFYIFFPLLLILLHRWQRIGAGLSLLILAGFALSVLTTMEATSLSFYSPLSRVWELASGAVLAWATVHHPTAFKAAPWTRALPGLGLAVLLWELATRDFYGGNHPGLSTLPTIAAMVLIIWFASPRDPATRFLSSRAMIGIGLISYALYLWHFPIFAFGRRLEAAPELTDKAIWTALAVGLSVLTYHVVERPFRSRLKPRAFSLSMGFASAGVAVFVLSLFVFDGYRGRWDVLAARYDGNEFDNDVLRDASWQLLGALASGERIDAQNAATPSQDERNRLWFQDPDAVRVLVVGNSHSKDMFNALHLNKDAFAGFDFARFAMAPSFPADQRQMLFAAPNFEAADVILLAPRYDGQVLARLPGFIADLRASGKWIVLANNTAEFQSRDNLPLFDWRKRQPPAADEYAALNALAYRLQDNSLSVRNAQLADLAQTQGLPVLSRYDLLCDTARETCAVVTPEGRKSLYDYGHWTIDAARFAGAQAVLQNWAAGLMPPADQGGGNGAVVRN